MTPFQKLRSDAGLTQSQVATAVGVSTNNVSAWERNLASPRPPMWDALAKVYRVNVNKIVEAVRANADLRTTAAA